MEEKELKRLYANRAVALARLYRTEEADECYRKFLSLGDSLKDREQRSAAIELATVYDIARKDMQIEKDAAKLRVRNVLLWTVSVIVLVLVFAIWRIWRHHLIIKEKNRIQTRTIEELLEARLSWRRRKPKPWPRKRPGLRKRRTKSAISTVFASFCIKTICFLTLNCRGTT